MPSLEANCIAQASLLSSVRGQAMPLCLCWQVLCPPIKSAVATQSSGVAPLTSPLHKARKLCAGYAGDIAT